MPAARALPDLGVWVLVRTDGVALEVVVTVQPRAADGWSDFRGLEPQSIRRRVPDDPPVRSLLGRFEGSLTNGPSEVSGWRSEVGDHLTALLGYVKGWPDPSRGD